MSQSIKIADLTIEEDHSFFVIAGPCVIENEALTLEIARFLKEASETLEVPIIFKTSYDKANRTSLQSFRGPGIDVGLEIIQKVPTQLHTPLMSGSNAISGITIIGALIAAGAGTWLGGTLGLLAVIAAMINVAGGYLVTDRMLRMFKRKR